jgi:hypothetical protein
VLGAAPSCLVPPDPPVTPVLANYPPVIITSKLSPSQTQLVINPNCAFTVRLETGGIVDPDNDGVTVRLVTNNGAPNQAKVVQTAFLGQGRATLAFDVPVSPFSFEPKPEIPTSSAAANQTMTLFATDASGFLNPDTSTIAVDFGTIDLGPAQDRYVVERDWFVHFVDQAGCNVQ